MELVNSIIKLLVPNKMINKSEKNKENQKYYEAEYLLDEFDIPNFNELLDCFLLFRDISGETKDTLHIEMHTERNKGIINKDSCHIISSKDTNDDIKEILEKFLMEITEFKKLDDSKYRFILKITKPIMTEESVSRIYSLKLFREYLKRLSLKKFIVNAGKNLEKSEYSVFLIDDIHKEFYTHNILFIHSLKNKEKVVKLLNEEIDTNNCVNFYNENYLFKSGLLNVTPYTYKLIEKSEFESINNLFNNIVSYLSLIFLSERSSLKDDNTILCYIKGYTIIKIEKQFGKDILTETSLYDIFKWVYCQDKIEVCFNIATNIISLEYRKDIKNINKSVLESIESNYIIYSIDNVERYIDIKSNIISSISELGTIYSNSINNLITKLKSALGVNITFFITIIIFNLIENKKSNLFTLDILVISLIIVSGSFIYLLISTETAMIDLYKFHNNILNIKESYNNLLAEEDINSTISSFYTKDTFAKAKEEVLYYSSLGIILLFTIVFGVMILSPEVRKFILKLHIILKLIGLPLLILIIIYLYIKIIETVEKHIVYKYEYDENEKIIYNFLLNELFNKKH